MLTGGKFPGVAILGEYDKKQKNFIGLLSFN